MVEPHLVRRAFVVWAVDTTDVSVIEPLLVLEGPSLSERKAFRLLRKFRAVSSCQIARINSTSGTTNATIAHMILLKQRRLERGFPGKTFI